MVYFNILSPQFAELNNIITMTENFYNWEQITICATSCCNLQCRMCPVITRDKKSLTQKQALHIADFALRKKVKRVVIGGGEPTLLPYLKELIDTLSKNFIEIWILTNATRFSEDDIRYYAEHQNVILNISIDGIGEVHDYIRGEGNFEKTNKVFLSLIENGAKVAINTVIQKSNFTHSIETYEYFKNFPLIWHGFSFAESYHQKELVPLENLPEAINQLYEILQRDSLANKHVSLSQEMIKGFELSFRYPNLIMHPGENCPIPTTHLGIDEEGWVLPCWHYPWLKKESRNINNRTIDEIIEDPNIKEEILHAIGNNGCKGCSTVCYFWNEAFREKAMYPKGKWKWQRQWMLAKMTTQDRFPLLYNLARKTKNIFKH